MLQRELVFYGAQVSSWLLLRGGVLLASLVVIALLMRYELRLVPRRVGAMLLVLRTSVLALLFLTCLQPVLTWTIDRRQTGRILVAVDVSESMSTADGHASPAEKLRWAKALDMLGQRDLDRWIDALEAGREPEWVADAETADPERRRALEEARRQIVRGAFDELGKLSRREIAYRLLTQTSQPLLPKLNELATVDLVVFSGRSESADAETLSRLVSQPPASVLTSLSDLSQPLSGAGSGNLGVGGGNVEGGSSGAAQRLLGIVLFTDGRDNAGGSPRSLALRSGQAGIPVYPVLLGSVLPPTDVSIASLEAPHVVYKDDKAVAKVTLHAAGFEGQEIPVLLEREGREPIVRNAKVAAPTATVEFPIDSTEIGRQALVVRVGPRPGETREDNNRREFAVNVVDDKVSALLVEGEARWEFRFVDNALSRDERVKLSRVVHLQPFVGRLNEPFFPQSLTLPADANDAAKSPFAEPDLVIVGDVSPTQLSPLGWELLEKFVSESGGTLVLVAGKRHLPFGYRSDVVDRLMPIVDWRIVDLAGPTAEESPTERGFRLRITPEGERESMLQFDLDPEANREIWAGLPGHLWGTFGRAKPGATVLATAVGIGQGHGLDDERRQAAIVHQHYGLGQVIWIGIDSTWRWRHRVGDRYHHQFWGQLARWAAENRSQAGNDVVRFGPERSDVEVGNDAVIRARWNQIFARKHPGLKSNVEIFRGDAPEGAKPFQTLPLVPTDGRPLVHEAKATSLPPGRYVLKLVVVEGAELEANDQFEAELYVHDRPTLELADLSANRKLLDEVADDSGGRLFLPDQLRELPELFRATDLHSTERKETELWDHWLVLLAFFALLTCEWVVRKLNGLP